MNTELAPIQKSATMVAQYARHLVSTDRAKQFVTTLSLMTKDQPKLAIATPQSLLAAMMACVHLDILPNTPEHLAYIIPYSDKSGHINAQFQIGYRGMIELAYRSGEIKSISAELVFPEDKFKVELGTKRRLVHIPDYSIDRTKYEKVTHVYATAEMMNGNVLFEVLSLADLKKVQKTTKAKSTDSPWNTWGEQMAKKTAIKRLLKYLPASRIDKSLLMGAQYDSLAEAGKLAIKNGEIVENAIEDIVEEPKTIVEEPPKTHTAVSVNDKIAEMNDNSSQEIPQEEIDALMDSADQQEQLSIKSEPKKREYHG